MAQTWRNGFDFHTCEFQIYSLMTNFIHTSHMPLALHGSRLPSDARSASLILFTFGDSRPHNGLNLNYVETIASRVFPERINCYFYQLRY